MNSVSIISLYKQSSNHVVFGISLEKKNANLVFKACENIQWCKNTCYFEVGFKACENIHLSKKYRLLSKNTNWTTDNKRISTTFFILLPVQCHFITQILSEGAV